MSALPVKSLPHTLQCRHTCPRVDKQGENTEIYITLQSNSDDYIADRNYQHHITILPQLFLLFKYKFGKK